jgi:hypothetical protein
MKRYYFFGCLLLAGLLPLAGMTQTSVPATAAVLHDHFAGQLSPGAQAWVTNQVAQMVARGQFNAPALTLDIQARFAGQPVGTPEVQALSLVILVEAVRSAEFSVTNLETQLAGLEAARVAVARAAHVRQKPISENTVPNRMVVAGAPAPAGTNGTFVDPRVEERLVRQFFQAQAAAKQLGMDLKYFQSQAIELVHAQLGGLK